MHPPSPLSLRALLAISIAALPALPGAGCSSRGGGGGGSRKPAGSGPVTVLATSPAGGASDVAADTTIQVTFSAGIDFSTVSSESFAVEGSTSGKKRGAYSHVEGSNRVVFAPDGAFLAGESVRVRITRALRSRARTRVTPAEFSFAIVRGATPPPGPPPPPAPTGLTVLESEPRPYDLDVPLDAVVTVRWSEPLDAATLRPENAWLSGSLTGRLSAGLVATDGGSTLRIIPDRLFEAGEAVTVHLSDALRASSGASFAGMTSQFRVRAEAPPSSPVTDHVFGALARVSQLASADFNLDRLADLVYASENEAVIDVLLGRGDGTFTPALRIDAGQTILSLAVADIDLDGDTDILAGTLDRARAYINRSREEPPAAGSIRFEVGPEAPTGAAVRGIAAGDLDHHGLPDVVLDTDRGLRVHLAGIDALPAQVIGSSRQSRTPLVLADLDLDGHTDLVFGDRHGSRVTYYISSGSSGGSASPGGPFGEPEHLDIGTDADQVAVENLGAGALPEIVILTAEGASAGGAAFRIARRIGAAYSVERGSVDLGAGGAEAAADAALDSGRFTLADLDGNGFPDLILAAAALGRVVWFPNIAGRIDLDGGARLLLGVPEALLPAAADLTNDGSLEILTAGRNEIHALLPVEGPPPPPPAEERFLLAVDDAQARQKDTGASALVRLTNTKPVQAYSVALGYDARAVAPTQVTIDGTITGEGNVEFSAAAVLASESAVTYHVIVELVPPFEGRVLPAGENQLLFRVLYDVLETAPLGDTSFAFLEGAGDPRVPTELVVEDRALVPALTPGKLTVLPPKEPPPPKGNQMALGTARVAPGAEGSVSVLGSNQESAEAFTSIVAVDNDAIEILELDLAGSVTETLAPELVVPNILAAEGHAVITVLFDFLPPFDKRTLPAGEDRLLFTVRFRARPEAAVGTHAIGFENHVGSPPLNNIFVFAGQSIFPDLVPGEVRIEGGAPPTFVRGDFDGTRKLDLSDAVALVNHLFKGGPAPACLEAADTDDTGLVDLTDAIYLLNHLFKGGPPPAPPYPDPGPDPTPDDLGCAPAP